MKNFDEKLNKAFARYTETEFSADVPHEYTPENRERAEKILGKTKKEEMPQLKCTGISSAVFSVLSEVYNNSQVVCFSSNFSSNDPRLI